MTWMGKLWIQSKHHNKYHLTFKPCYQPLSFQFTKAHQLPPEKLSRVHLRNHSLEQGRLFTGSTYTSVRIWDSTLCRCRCMFSEVDIRISELFLLVTDFILHLSFSSSSANSLTALRHWQETLTSIIIEQQNWKLGCISLQISVRR